MRILVPQFKPDSPVAIYPKKVISKITIHEKQTPLA
jgi:hypothetical protein